MLWFTIIFCPRWGALSNIWFTNKKLHKMGYVQDGKCSLCKSDSESFTTSFSNADAPSSFGRNFNITFTYWQENSSVWPYKTLLQEYYGHIAFYWIIWYWLLNKLYLWDCWRNQTLSIITAFSSTVKIKYETEKYICVKTNKWTNLKKKWALHLDSVP